MKSELIEKKYKTAIDILSKGFTHIQFRYGGFIKVIKNKDEFNYELIYNDSNKIFTTNILKEAILEAHENGWCHIVSCK